MTLPIARRAHGAVFKTVTANRLNDGIAVWLGPEGRWVERLAEALAIPAAEAEAALAVVKAAPDAHRLCDPYLIELAETPAGLGAASHRERIRAAGPTVRRDLGKQAERP
jgi:hypothetical protein